MWRSVRFRRFCSVSVKKLREQRKKEAKLHQDPKGYLKIWEAPTEHPAKRIQRLERRASDLQLEKFAKLTPAKTIQSEVFSFLSWDVKTLQCSLRLRTDFLDCLRSWKGEHFFAGTVEFLLAALTHGSFVHHILRVDHESVSQQATLNVLGAFALKLSLLEFLLPSKRKLETFSSMEIAEIENMLRRCDSLANTSVLTKLALEMNLPFLVRRFPADPRAVAGVPPVVGLSPTEWKGLNSVLCESVQALTAAAFLVKGLQGSVDFLQEYCNPLNVAQDEKKDVHSEFLSAFVGEDFDPRKRSRVLLLDPESTLHDLLNRLSVRKKRQDPESKVKFNLNYKTLENHRDSANAFPYMVTLECCDEILATGAADSEAGARKAAARAVISLIGGKKLCSAPMDEAFHPVYNSQVPKPGNYSSRASAFRCLKMFEKVGLIDEVTVEVRHSNVGSRFLRIGRHAEDTGTMTGIVRVGEKTYESKRMYDTESQAKDAAAELALGDICSNLSANSSQSVSSPVATYASQFRWLHETSRFYSAARYTKIDSNLVHEKLCQILDNSNYLVANEKTLLSKMPVEYDEMSRKIGRIVLHLWGCVEYARLHGMTGWQEDVEKFVKGLLRSEKLHRVFETFGIASKTTQQTPQMNGVESLSVLEALVGCLYLSRGCDSTIELLHQASIRNV
ncbi:hypothetical protein GAYE_SCF27MG4695 [Galdieria yellowstonensis]|uniref:DRBM domain-containing protein n=1 Tax=Galdieria yellowstonensis TaxID=3028027 RepID=A0AAV9IHJ9_9RHOD|nr:hypothetical protein GAYE_SCF27MG4695 [Galdieria yellowstonensis]